VNPTKSITQSPGGKPVDMLVLPPVGARIPRAFRAIEVNDQLHAEFLASAQRFRGEMYLQDGAVRKQQLSPDGRHRLPIDTESWHILNLNEEGRTCGCLRLHQEPSGRFCDPLPLPPTALAHCPNWGGKLKKAVQTEIARAREEHLLFGDVGGWAIAPDRRRGLDCLRMILAGYSLMQLLGGVVGIATATCKHGSAQILRKLGLRPLEADGESIPAYYDAHYNSEMEVLRFDSRHPNPKYGSWIAELTSYLTYVPVISSQGGKGIGPAWRMAPLELWHPAQSAATFS
jgi:hypothetical protein